MIREMYVVIWRCEDDHEVQIIGAYDSFEKAFKAMMENHEDQVEQCEAEEIIDSWSDDDSARLSTKYNEQYWDIQCVTVQ